MALGPEIESIRHDNLPSPRQVGELATKLVEFAERHGQLSIYDESLDQSTRKQIVKPMQIFEAPSLDIPDVYLLQSTTGAHLQEKAAGVRRLRIYDSLVRKELAVPGGRGVRSVYDFLWNDEATIDARRRLTILPQQNDELPLIDEIDQMMTTGRSPFSDSNLAMMDVVMEFDNLSADDSLMLARQIDSLMADIDDGKRQYREPDHEYADFIARY